MKPRVLRFIGNGVMTTCIHTLVVYLLIKFYVLDIGFVNALAFLTATSFSYVVNTKWTFGTQHSSQVMFRYAVVACLGSILAYLLASFCEAMGLPWWCGVVLIVAVTPMFTWQAHKSWTYASLD
ncbi:MAG TPA: GtrA family protein [Methylotenera sp.]